MPDILPDGLCVLSLHWYNPQTWLKVGTPDNTPTSPQTMSHRKGKKPTQPVASSGSAKPNDVVPHVYQDPKLKPPTNGRPPSFRSFPPGTVCGSHLVVLQYV